MLKRSFLGLLAVVAILAGVVIAPTVSYADEVICDPVTLKCYTIIDQPGSDPISKPDPETGFTPGPAVCSWASSDAGSIEVPCSSDDGAWNNAKGCYVAIDPTQRPAPPGGDPGGAWYYCARTPSCDLDPRCFFTGGWWSDTPPSGINTLTPGQAAQRLAQSFQLQGINIGFAPDPNTPGSVGYVGIPIWMWVNNPTPLTYGPYRQTATLGGVTIAATASVRSILWNMGDNGTVACSNPGTPYQVSFGLTDSPNCGYRYSTISNGRYNVTALSQWTVDWTGGGQTGSIPLTATSNTTIEVRELQSVNVG